MLDLKKIREELGEELGEDLIKDCINLFNTAQTCHYQCETKAEVLEFEA
jgi:hypothetical protein